MKKLLVLALALIMVMFFAACDGNGGGNVIKDTTGLPLILASKS